MKSIQLLGLDVGNILVGGSELRIPVSSEYSRFFDANETIPVKDIYWNEIYGKWWAVNTVGYDKRCDPSPMHLFEFDCPFGKVGDTLWVQEEHNISINNDAVMYCDFGGKLAPNAKRGSENWAREWKLAPADKMPRWASRINLQIGHLRVERLREIDDDGIDASGIYGRIFDESIYPKIEYYDETNRRCTDFGSKALFANLWNDFHPEISHKWQINPFVWVIGYIWIK